MRKGVGIFFNENEKRERRHDVGQQGFTLVEMLVVITIIGLIMGLIGPRVLNYLSESKVKAARIQLQSFAERARPVLSRCRPLSVDRRRGLSALMQRTPGVGGLERALSEGQQPAERSLEPSLRLPRAGRSRAL